MSTPPGVLHWHLAPVRLWENRSRLFCPATNLFKIKEDETDEE
jgi:hypothetical protein